VAANGKLSTGQYPFPWLLVEGGGTRTWVAVIDGDRNVQVTGPTTNVVTSSLATARQRFRALFGSVLNAAGIEGRDVRLVFAAHASAASQRWAERLAEVCSGVLADLGARSDLIVTSDMVPVITSGEGEAVVAGIAGTGTVFVAHREFKHWARSSGSDYVLSDQGGGFDLAMQGLRAAVRASDGRGPATSLVALAREWAGAPDGLRLSDALYNHVYVPQMRSLVAGFTPLVARAAGDGDAVAVQLVEYAADEFSSGVRSVAQQVSIAHESPLVIMSGSLATVESPLRRAILKRIHQDLAPNAVTDYQPEDLAAKVTGVVALLDEGGARLEGLRAVLPMTIRQIGRSRPGSNKS
jgi:N-acetylglucosamine kinase-like BadF-type ATPase